MARRITLLRLLFAAVACLVRADADDDKFYFPGHEYDRTPLGDSIDRASVKLLKEAYNAADNKNIIMSPVSVFMLVSLYSAGAEGPIRDEAVTALGSSNYAEMYSGYGDLNRQYSNMDANLLTLANKVWVSNQYSLATGFSDVARTAYNSEVEALDFHDPAAAADAINKWGEEKSHGNIKDAVSKDALDSSVAAALVNVIYFQGHWGLPFDANETIDETFHLDKTQTVQKPMMQLTSSLFYHESELLGAKLIELPYKEDNFRMVVILPNEIDGLNSVMEKVSQHGLLSEIFNLGPAGFEIHLHMPKFNINSEHDLNSLLPKIGVSKIFTDGATGIVREAPVKVAKAFQKAMLKVDEEGATAAAFTGLIAVPMSSFYEPPPPVEIKVDHPFMFAILEKDKILFIGNHIN